jgi:hypothetical protein
MLEKSHESCGLNVNSPAHSKYRVYYIVKMTSMSAQGASFCPGEYKTATSSKVMKMTYNEDCCNLELKCSHISECWHLQVDFCMVMFFCVHIHERVVHLKSEWGTEDTGSDIRLEGSG